MKRAERSVEPMVATRVEEEITPLAILILETMVAIGRPYGPAYTAQILTADKFLAFRHLHHRDIETYGKLRNRNLADVHCLIHYLIDIELVDVDPNFVTVKPSDIGLEWLSNPQALFVQRDRARYSSLEKYLRDMLRNYRRNVAETENKKLWEVMSDYSMDRVVQVKPLDLDGLREIDGFSTSRCESFGIGIIKTVQDVLEHYDDYVLQSLIYKVRRKSFQRVKKLFLENVTIPEIAKVCAVQLSTICSYLRDLHTANEIDLIPWIERNLNSKALYKGVEYFERVRFPSLKEAHLTLGLDYETLLFCRLYAKDKQMRQRELQAS